MTTLGRRLERQALALISHRRETLGKVERRDSMLTRRLPVSTNRRIRVEVDVHSIWGELPTDVGRHMLSPPPSSTIPATRYDGRGDPATTGRQHLPAALRERLQPTNGHRLEHVVLHTGEGAAAVAQGQGAEAVTIGEDIFLSHNRSQPGEADLLNHEIWHATQSGRPGTAWRRATEQGRAAEEEDAATYAADQAGRYWGPMPVGPTTPSYHRTAAHQIASSSSHITNLAGVGSAAEHPMTGHRSTAATPTRPPAMTPPSPESPDSRYREVLRQIQQDRERGA